MKKTVLFGAGQAGAMIARLMGTDYQTLCFADNSEKKRGGTLLGLPVVSPEESLLLKPDCFCLCVTDAERADQMEKQLRALGFAGEILRAGALRAFDARAAVMRLLSEQIRQEDIPGDTAELGVFRGDFAAMIQAAFPGRTIHLFDTFEGFSESDVAVERQKGFSGAKPGDFSDTGMELVRQKLCDPEKAVFHCGHFPETFRGCENAEFAFVSVDADLYQPTAAALPLFWERLSSGGVLLIHDVNSAQFAGAGQAVREFCRERKLLFMPVCDLHGSAVLRKP